MHQPSLNWNERKHLRFTNRLSNATLALVKEQVSSFLRDREKDSLHEAFMNWESKENEIMLYADYSEVGFDLPSIFDCIAQIILPENRIDVKVKIPYAVWNGWSVINKIEKGHKHVCLLQFPDEVPAIIKDLPESNSRQHGSRGELILYNLADISYEQ